MDIVDAQLHLGPDGVESTLAAMDALGIRGVVIDEFWGRRPYGDPEFFEPGFTLPNGAWRSLSPTAQAACIRYPDRFTSVVRVDRRDPDLEGVVRAAHASPYVSALRILPTWTPAEVRAFADGDYDEMFALATAHGLPVFVHAPGYVELVAPYATRFPDLSLIVDHCGMPHPGLWIGRTAQEQARVEDPTYFDEVLRLSEFPGVSLKWSHEQIAFRSERYPFTETRPYLRAAIGAFGVDRLLWASDKTVIPHTWSDVLHSVRDNPDLTQAETEALLGGSARRVLDWHEAEDAAA